MELKRLFPSEKLSYLTPFRNGNCYTYALNLTDVAWAWPGTLKDPRRNPHNLYDMTKTFIAQALLQDGLKQIHPNAACTHIFAAAVSPQKDFHFFRRDHDGLWSHKIGPLPPQRIDTPENYLTYSDFVGYFTIPPKGILYAPF